MKEDLQKIKGWEYAPGNTQRVIVKMLDALAGRSDKWALNLTDGVSRPYTKSELGRFLNLNNSSHLKSSNENIFNNLLGLGILKKEVFRKKNVQGAEKFDTYSINFSKLKEKEFEKNSVS